MDDAGSADTRVTIDRLSVSADDAKSPVDADFRGTIDGTAVTLAGELGSLATLVERRLPYPVAVKGEVAGRKAAVALKVHRADRLVQLQDIDVTFGSSNLKGRVDIRDERARSAWTVDLAASALDVDDLPVMRPAASASKPAAPAAKPGAPAGVVAVSCSPMPRFRSTHCARTTQPAR